ncbi:MAG: FAD-dependent oxidoreductase [Clostridia bacterium]|nr:FAD-dependent oxidoreductase [Clostridia bacterium]
MILVSNIMLPLDADFSDLAPVAAKALKTDISKIRSASLFKKSVDARKKPDIKFCVSILCEVSGDEAKIIKKNKNALCYTEPVYTYKKCKAMIEHRPVVVGFGPAGMFCALALARAGLKPIVAERGNDVDTRTKDITAFFGGARLKPESNIQFGEGGAGTFSDGKLNTGIKDKRIREILKTFVLFGAPENILTDAKPHIGTDILKKVVKNIREEIISLGGEVRFGCLFEGAEFQNGKLDFATLGGEKVKTDTLVLAIGHSARDTFKSLYESGFSMEKKPFAVGVRIEHLQSDINKSLYGDLAENENLGAADYKLAVHLESGRGVYTFCMCPGGEVVNASSEQGGIAVNGMSENARNGKNANSAVLVGIDPADFPSDDVLSGIELQRSIEQKAYKIGSGAVPITTLGNLLEGKPPVIGKVIPTVKPATVFADMYDIFPGFVVDSIKDGIRLFDKKIKGFADAESIITAPETRSSSPVRILRDGSGEARGKEGVYPCGEGAGYAGGIMSSAVDGLKTAEKIIEKLDSL